MQEETNISLYSLIENGTNKKFYYAKTNKKGKAKLGTEFRKGKDEQGTEIQQLVSETKKLNNNENSSNIIILSPISSEEIKDVVNNYEQGKLENIITRFNQTNAQALTGIRKNGTECDDKIEIIARSEEEEKFGALMTSRYQGYYETRINYNKNNTIVNENSDKNITSKQGNELYESETLSKGRARVLKPNNQGNAGYISWYGIALTLVLALIVGYSIAYVIWNYIR